jgi:hypothetical protein
MCYIVYTVSLEWLGLKHNVVEIYYILLTEQNTSNRTVVDTSSNIKHSLYNSIVQLTE